MEGQRQQVDQGTMEEDDGQGTSDLLELDLSESHLTALPPNVAFLGHLVLLDVSKNNIRHLSDSVMTQLGHLERLEARNNRLKELPSVLSSLPRLTIVNISGNVFEHFPEVLCNMPWLRDLQIGANALERLPESIGQMKALVHLYLGGNRLRQLPHSLGSLGNLETLHLNDNNLDQLPNELQSLSSLKTLSLHGNFFVSLPSHIMRLPCLQNISLRNNPLVLRFVREHVNDVASLLELSGRCIKQFNVSYDGRQLPRPLVAFLNSAKRCDNPSCSGVYFTHHIRKIKFSDFCGKYRVPLMHYLCSSCYEDSPTDTDDVSAKQVNKVLLS
jgi:Leucine-rich repeat (LRR) protein